MNGRSWLRISAGVALLSAMISCSSNFDQTKFDATDRSAKAIQAATGVGVNYPKFGEVLQSFATELLVVKGKVGSDHERQLLGLYAEAYGHYARSYEVWAEKLKYPSLDKLLTIPNSDLETVYHVRTEPDSKP